MQSLVCSIAYWATALYLPLVSSFASEPPRYIATTTNIIADTVKQLADPSTEIVSLMGPGVDPHTYKASPVDLRKLTQASIVFTNGLHLEGRLADILEKISLRGKSIYAVSSAIPSDLLRRISKDGSAVDPHIWFDVSLWIKAVEGIRDTLQAADPARSDEYDQRAKKYTGELQILHNWSIQQISLVQASQRVLITAHDAFGYFGRAYGLEVHGIQGLSTDSEATIHDINRLVSIIVERKIPAVFIETSVSPRTVEALLEGAQANGATVTLGGELASDALGPENSPTGSYTGMIRHNVTQIVKALHGKTSHD